VQTPGAVIFDAIYDRVAKRFSLKFLPSVVFRAAVSYWFTKECAVQYDLQVQGQKLLYPFAGVHACLLRRTVSSRRLARTDLNWFRSGREGRMGSGDVGNTLTECWKRPIPEN